MSAEAQSRKESLRGVFNRAASTYDRIGPRYFSHFGRRLVELAQPEPGSRLLDVAAGRGAVMFPAAELVGPQGLVVGVDLAEEMVQQTSADIRQRGLGHVQMMAMDAEKLEFADGSFDMVLCGFGVFFLPQPAQALSEFYRVLRPGGKVALSLWGKSDERWNWISEAGLRPGSRPGEGANRPAHLASTEWLEQALAQAGFSDIRVQLEEATFNFASPQEWWETEWSHGARSCLERMTPEALAQAQAFAYDRLEGMREPGGIPHTYRVNMVSALRPAA